MTLIPPFDHPRRHRRPGHGGAGADRGGRRRSTPCSSASAAAACSRARRSRHGRCAPSCSVYGVEPEAGNDGQQSFRSGRIVTIETPETIADGAQTQHLGDYTFAIIQRDVDDVLTATDATGRGDALLRRADEDRRRADRLPRLRGSARAGAALAGKRVGVIISGGNVDLGRYATLLATSRPAGEPAAASGSLRSRARARQRPRGRELGLVFPPVVRVGVDRTSRRRPASAISRSASSLRQLCR